jgi:hypothetical protein
MLSYIDPIIFPDECEVLEILPGQQYVYPIFKNGSSALYGSGYRLLDKHEVAALETVDVFVRAPMERFVSGVQMYLSKLPDTYHRDTVLHFVDRYLFLNRHYAPQFHWLLNLSRHTKARIRLRSVSELSQVTRNVTPYTLNNPPREQALAEFFNDNMRLHFYLQLDNALMDLVGQTVSLKDIVEHIRTRYPDAYKEIIERSITLCNALV